MIAGSTSPTLAGVLPVFQTPYHDDESIDFDTLKREIDWLLECGANGIVMAMVSEILRLSTEERCQLAAATCRVVRGRGSVVISVGAESSKLAEDFARQAEQCGANALMAITPATTALSETEAMRYFGRILRSVKIPLIVQDASGYVGRPLSIELYSRLLEEFGDRVYFKPEALPIGPRLSTLRDATGGVARAFEGSGGIALVDSYRRGIVGTIPGADLIHGMVALWRALKAGDDSRAYQLSLPISALVALQTSLDGFLAVEKYLLVKQGVLPNALVRGPVSFVLDEETRREVDRLFDLLSRALEAL
jgi:dihydrodipicolinate synthase/N-acetylneuraminate lyase